MIRARAATPAFSLVEVLVAVLVLALGLLGLGAVFPMVVRQQRIATETTLGLSATEAVKQILVNNDNFRPGGRGWAAIRYHVTSGPGKSGRWVALPLDPDTGAYVLRAAPSDTNQTDIVLPLSQRLYPLPFSTESQPRFVWDIAARVTDPFDPRSPMIVAVSLRNIDPGIRPALYQNAQGDMVPYSLTTTLVGGLSPRDRRNPISVDRDGRPTLDGSTTRGATYSLPVVVEITGPGVDPDRGELFVEDVLSPDTTLDVASRLLAVPGQRFLDRQGNVYAVTGARNIGGGKQIIRFTPDIVATDANGDGRFDDTDLNPVVFFPQATSIDPLLFTVAP